MTIFFESDAPNLLFAFHRIKLLENERETHKPKKQAGSKIVPTAREYNKAFNIINHKQSSKDYF